MPRHETFAPSDNTLNYNVHSDCCRQLREWLSIKYFIYFIPFFVSFALFCLLMDALKGAGRRNFQFIEPHWGRQIL